MTLPRIPEVTAAERRRVLHEAETLLALLEQPVTRHVPPPLPRIQLVLARLLRVARATPTP
jgi:hypothetical protein